MRRYRALIYWTAGGGLLLGLLTGRACAADVAGPVPVSTPDLLQVRKEIVVRLADGTPAAGIAVRLAPTPPEAGGPPGGAPAQIATTDAQGTATFQGLGGWI